MPRAAKNTCEVCASPAVKRFCSNPCRSKGMTKAVGRLCHHCGSPFVARAAAVANGEGQFCSRRCAAKARNAPEPLHVKFHRYYQPGDPASCWTWKGTLDRDGYGVITEHRKQLRAHRLSYQLAHGPVPTGRQVLHACDNPSCVNPAHLRVGTAADNNRDKAEKGRASSKLGTDDVRHIRAMLAAGHTATSIAAKYGVTDVCIWHIKHGHTWSHVT